ncbi:MAG: ABC transporter substrate-binding protein, partial [Dehalococcoidia bacterium]
MVNEISTWLGKPRKLFFILPVLLLLFALACGSAAAPEPAVIEKEVIKEVPVEKEVIREVEVEKEVIKEVEVEKEVIKEIPVEKIVVVTPVIAKAPKDIKPTGTLNVALTGLGPFLAHPALASGTATDVVSTAVSEALWQYDVNREAIPMLVESWKLSDDFTTWTLHLRKGVQFHKGYGEMTAEDVVWSMEQRVLNPKATNIVPLTQAWQTSVEMPDPYTMIVNTGDPMPGWLFIDQVRNPGDQYVVSKKQTDDIGAEAANVDIAATGPWEIGQHRSGEFWRMRAVEDHWRKTPHFQEMIMWEIPEEATRLAGFQTGELDTFPMSYDSIALVTKVPGAKIMRIPKAAVMNLRIYGGFYAQLGTENQPPAYDPALPWVSADPDLNSAEWERAVKVRQAMMLAIDMDTIIETLLQGF